MILKFNAPVPKTSTAIPYYKNLFDGKVIKDGVNDGHAYIMLFGKISLHIHSTGKISKNNGYLIIRFENSERKIYKKAVEKISKQIDVEIKRENKKMVWGTTLTEFVDKYGYKWVLEIDTK